MQVTILNLSFLLCHTDASWSKIVFGSSSDKVALAFIVSIFLLLESIGNNSLCAKPSVIQLFIYESFLLQ